jgi:hypothetical protein
MQKTHSQEANPMPNPDQLLNDMGEPFTARQIDFMRRAEEIKAADAVLELAARRTYAAHLAAGGARVYRRDGRELFDAKP